MSTSLTRCRPPGALRPVSPSCSPPAPDPPTHSPPDQCIATHWKHSLHSWPALSISHLRHPQIPPNPVTPWLTPSRDPALTRAGICLHGAVQNGGYLRLLPGPPVDLPLHVMVRGLHGGGGWVGGGVVIVNNIRDGFSHCNISFCCLILAVVDPHVTGDVYHVGLYPT